MYNVRCELFFMCLPCDGLELFLISGIWILIRFSQDLTFQNHQATKTNLTQVMI